MHTIESLFVRQPACCLYRQRGKVGCVFVLGRGRVWFGGDKLETARHAGIRQRQDRGKGALFWEQ